MAVDVKPALLRGHMHGHQGNWNIDIEQHAACLAVHVVMPLHPAVVTTCLVGEGQLLDQPMFCQEMKRAIDRAVPDVRIAATDSLENLPGGEMRFRLANRLQHGCTLGRVLEPLTWHYPTFQRSR